MYETYLRLVADFCAAVRLDDVARVADGGAFEIDNVTFSFSYREYLDRQTFFLFADCGTLDESDEQACRHVLERNFGEMLARFAAFAVSPVTGAVVHVQRFPLESASPQAILEQVRDTIAAVNELRAACFSGEKGLA